MTQKMLRRILLTITIILLASFLTGCNTVRSQKQVVNAVVTNKEYTEEHLDYGYYFDVWKGKFRWKFKLFPAEYKVTIRYQSITETYELKSLYDSYEIGDTIEVDLLTYYENGELITDGYYAPSMSIHY